MWVNKAPSRKTKMLWRQGLPKSPTDGETEAQTARGRV